MPMTKPGKFDSKGAWDGFRGEIWQEEINVRDFIQKNYTPYDGDESFLAGPTERSLKIKKIIEETKAHYEETRFPMDTRPTSIADIPAGYISKDDELIYGIQNDELFKLNFMPKGGIRMAETALKYPSCTSRTHCNWTSRCLLSWPYHRCLCSPRSLRC